MRAVAKSAAIAAAILVLAAPAKATDFAQGSEAKEWGLIGERKARFSARVVDVLCELTSDCPADCGGGKRQLGLLRDADGALVYALKNTQPAFTGAATDLQPYCGKAVEVDGVTVQADEDAPAYYMVQLIREAGAADWSKTNRWTKDWAEANPALKDGKGPWFRRDPRVNAAIDKDGYLGLGAETDRAFIEYYFQ